MSLAYYKVTVLLASDNINNENVAKNTAIEIRKDSDGALASIFSDSLGASPIAQPSATTDNLGTFEFYAAVGVYRVVSGGETLKVYSHIEDGGAYNTQFARRDLSENFTASTTWDDNQEIRHGTGNDYRQYHSGVGMFQENTVGDWEFYEKVNNGTIHYYVDNGSGVKTLVASIGGAGVNFIGRYGGAETFRTVSGGTKTTGIHEATGGVNAPLISVDQPNAAHTADETERSTRLMCSNIGATTVTFDTNANQPFNQYDRVYIQRDTAAEVTIAPVSGAVTINNAVGFRIENQHDCVCMVYEGSDVWTLIGRVKV